MIIVKIKKIGIKKPEYVTRVCPVSQNCDLYQNQCKGTKFSANHQIFNLILQKKIWQDRKK